MRLPFLVRQGNRDESVAKDSIAINCYVETTADGVKTLIKRPGNNEAFDNTDGTARGLTFWNGEWISVVGTALRRGTTSIGTVGGTTAPYYFAPVGVSTKYLVLSDGTNAYWVDTSWTLTSITDTDFTNNAPFVAGLVALDSYIFTIQAAGRIFNSDLITGAVTPNNWSALSFLTAESQGDAGVAIGRHLNYVVAFKEHSIEFFFDAANVTGSPLRRIDGMKKEYGLANARTLAKFGPIYFFIAQTSEGGRFAAKIEKTADQVISSKEIDKILTEATLTDAYAMAFRWQGHTFYMLTLPTDNLTLVYDIKEGEWHVWQDGSGNYFKAAFMASNGPLIRFLHPTNGKILTIDEDIWQDDGSNYTVTARTPRWDGGTERWKRVRQARIFMDRNTSAVSLRYTDNDYATWSSSKSITVARPYVNNLGATRRRAFEVSFTANEPLRLWHMELETEAV